MSFKRVIMLLKRVNNLCAQDKKSKENFLSGVPYFHLIYLCSNGNARCIIKILSMFSCTMVLCFYSMRKNSMTIKSWKYSELLRPNIGLIDPGPFYETLKHVWITLLSLSHNTKSFRNRSIVCNKWFIIYWCIETYLTSLETQVALFYLYPFSIKKWKLLF